MKSVIFVFLVIITSTAFAAEVYDGKVDEKNENIEIYVQYQGCTNARFQLERGLCLEPSPLTCHYTLRQVSPKTDCSYTYSETLNFSFAALRINKSLYSKATLQIKGAGNSSVSLILPEFRDSLEE